MNKHAIPLTGLLLALLLTFVASNALAGTVTVYDSHGNPIQGASVQWSTNNFNTYSSGTTDVNGVVTTAPTSGTYSFRATYNYSSFTQTNRDIGLSDVVFRTSEMRAQAYYHDGTTPISNATAYFSAAGNFNNYVSATTDASGLATKEIFPTTIFVKVSIGNSSPQSPPQSLLLAGDGISGGAWSILTFYTSEMRAQVNKHDGTPYAGVTVDFSPDNFSNYSPSAVTDANGLAKKELFPGTIYTKAKGVNLTTSATDISGLAGDGASPGASSLVTFYTSLNIAQVNKCDNTGYSGVSVQYSTSSGFGTYGTMTTGVNGSASVEQFPGSYYFKSTKDGLNNQVFGYTLAGNSKTPGVTTTTTWYRDNCPPPPTTYTVTFDANGGTGSMSSQSANTSTALTLNSFTMTGYTFTGWNTAANGSGTSYANGASYDFTANITLYAQWTINTYTVTFNSNGGSAVSPITGVEYNTAVGLLPADPTKTGYTFGGWFTDNGTFANAFTAASIVTDDITVHAKWTAITFTLTYNAGAGGSITGETSQTVSYGESGSEVTATPTTGYSFVSWSDGVTSASRTDQNVTANLTVTANFTIACTAPSIIASPSDQTLCEGSSASFASTAGGDPAPSLQWQVSMDGGANWADMAGKTTSPLTFATNASQNGYKYRAVFTNTCGSAPSNVATVTVNTPPVVTTQPADQTVLAGCSATFGAAASGSPTPTVQWQMSTNGGTSWTDISGATSTTLTVSSATTSQSGRKYHAVFTNSCGSATTNAASLTVQPSARLIVQFIVYELLDNRCRPKVRCVPVEGAEVRVYTLKEVCANNLVVTGQPKIWGKIYDGLDGPGGTDPGCPVLSVGSYEAKGVTDANGLASIIVPPTTTKPDIDYVVIASTTAFDDIKTVEEPDALYSGVRIACIKAGDQKIVKLRRLRLFSGKIVPAQYLEEYGTYLAIVEPEYMDWDSDQEQYPFVFESDGDWSVTTSVEPPEGFVSDYPRLSAEVDDTTAAIQFTLTDVGSKWTRTGVKHEIRHKGKVKVRASGVPMFDKKKNKKKGKSAFSVIGGTGQDIMSGFVPAEYALYQNYPDPFNPSTVLQFDLPEPAVVSLKIYNVLGQETATLLDQIGYEPGRHRVTFNASRLASGVYVYRMTAGPFVQTKKMLLLR
jgi:uncharacterized repeat protein (TIGR02543 family)